MASTFTLGSNPAMLPRYHATPYPLDDWIDHQAIRPQVSIRFYDLRRSSLRQRRLRSHGERQETRPLPTCDVSFKLVARMSRTVVFGSYGAVLRIFGRVQYFESPPKSYESSSRVGMSTVPNGRLGVQRYGLGVDYRFYF